MAIIDCSLLHSDVAKVCNYLVWNTNALQLLILGCITMAATLSQGGCFTHTPPARFRMSNEILCVCCWAAPTSFLLVLLAYAQNLCLCQQNQFANKTSKKPVWKLTFLPGLTQAPLPTLEVEQPVTSTQSKVLPHCCWALHAWAPCLSLYFTG